MHINNILHMWCHLRNKCSKWCLSINPMESIHSTVSRCRCHSIQTSLSMENLTTIKRQELARLPKYPRTEKKLGRICLLSILSYALSTNKKVNLLFQMANNNNTMANNSRHKFNSKYNTSSSTNSITDSRCISTSLMDNCSLLPKCISSSNSSLFSWTEKRQTVGYHLIIRQLQHCLTSWRTKQYLQKMLREGRVRQSFWREISTTSNRSPLLLLIIKKSIGSRRSREMCRLI